MASLGYFFVMNTVSYDCTPGLYKAVYDMIHDDGPQNMWLPFSPKSLAVLR